MFNNTISSFFRFKTSFVLFTCLCFFLQCQTPTKVPSDAETNTQKMNDSAMNEDSNTPSSLFLYVGTYTRKEGHVDGKGKGIYIYQMDSQTGELSYYSEIGGITNPSYLTIHPNGKYLYAVSETGDGESSTVHAYTIDARTKKLTEINQQMAEGYAPCHISVEQTGKYALLANYTTGNVVMLPIGADGSLGVASDNAQHKDAQSKNNRPRAAHAHFVSADLNNRYAIAADLGMNRLYVYEMDLEQGKLVLKDVGEAAQGAGPRHLDFHPTLPYIYSLNELNGTIDSWKYDAESGKLTPNKPLPTYPNGHSGSIGSADIHIHPSGKFLYASNRAKLNNIAVFRIDEKTGDLTFLSHTDTQGKTPRSFVISPDGRFLLAANQDSSSIAVFSIDEQTGKLTPTGEVEEVMSPVCLKFY
ncbi:MAG: lactonase family protein [Chitinophagales bacterium]